MGRVLFHGDTFRSTRWFSSFAAYLTSQGHEVVYLRRNQLPRTLDFNHVFFCHGLHPTQAELRTLCDRVGVPSTIAEIGFFPQRNHFFLDRRGINAASMLMDDDLSWIGEPHLRRAREFAEGYVGQFRWTQANRYVFAPLQLARDTNITLHSPYKTMQAFIDHVEQTFPGEPIVFKTHPLDKTRSYRVAAGNTLVREGHLFELIRDARLVYGINSTVLYEAIMQGVPTRAVGEGLLKRHAGREDRLIAALVDQQIAVDEKDFGYWLGRYANAFLEDARRADHREPLARLRVAGSLRRIFREAQRKLGLE